LLLFIGLVAIFFITSLFDLSSLYPKDYMFTPIEGRLVIASRSGKPITDEELEKIVDKYGAEYSIHYDLLLDNSSEQNYVYYNELGQKFTNFDCTYTFDKHYGNNILGSYPSKDNQVLLAGGTYQGFYFNDNSVFLNSENFSQNQKIEQQNKHDNINGECLDDCDKCAKCKYKEFFYSQHNEQTVTLEKENKIEGILTNANGLNSLDVQSIEQNKQQIEQNSQQNSLNNQTILEQNEIMEKQKIKNIVSSIIPQFDNLFANYEADEQLNSLIENSKFVKIDENGEQFSIGAIYEENNLKFICYAIKRDYNINPPEELGEHYQWLPIDGEDPLSVGYYVVFQDACDLKIVEL
jgi:hypothetical protein